MGAKPSRTRATVRVAEPPGSRRCGPRPRTRPGRQAPHPERPGVVSLPRARIHHVPPPSSAGRRRWARVAAPRRRRPRPARRTRRRSGRRLPRRGAAALFVRPGSGRRPPSAVRRPRRRPRQRRCRPRPRCSSRLAGPQRDHAGRQAVNSKRPSVSAVVVRVDGASSRRHHRQLDLRPPHRLAGVGVDDEPLTAGAIRLDPAIAQAVSPAGGPRWRHSARIGGGCASMATTDATSTARDVRAHDINLRDRDPDSTRTPATRPRPGC